MSEWLLDIKCLICNEQWHWSITLNFSLGFFLIHRCIFFLQLAIPMSCLETITDACKKTGSLHSKLPPVMPPRQQANRTTKCTKVSVIFYFSKTNKTLHLVCDWELIGLELQWHSLFHCQNKSRFMKQGLPPLTLPNTLWSNKQKKTNFPRVSWLILFLNRESQSDYLCYQKA